MISNRERIFVAGHRGMVGSAILRALQRSGYSDIVTAPHAELDLREEQAVSAFLQRHRPSIVILAAAKVGGIRANQRYPAEFIRDNLAIQTNMIHQAYLAKVRRLVVLGSSCIYPRECPQPMKEEYLLTGPLEPTNEPYALAKIAGIRMAQSYYRQYGLDVICPMPCNLYGTNDSFDLENAHVLSSLVRRFSDAVAEGRLQVTVWGTGMARREFLHVDDMAEAVLLLLERWKSPEIINVGSGEDLTIRELAKLIAEVTGFTGEIRWDHNMPDGMPRKLLDVSRISSIGFRPHIRLHEGIERTVTEYRQRFLSPSLGQAARGSN